jgi:hypothetical protein
MQRADSMCQQQERRFLLWIHSQWLSTIAVVPLEKVRRVQRHLRHFELSQLLSQLACNHGRVGNRAAPRSNCQCAHFDADLRLSAVPAVGVAIHELAQLDGTHLQQPVGGHDDHFGRSFTDHLLPQTSKPGPNRQSIVELAIQHVQ